MGDKRLAFAIAGVIPILTLALVIYSAHAMAAPPPPTTIPNTPISPTSTGAPVCFYRDHAPACVNRVALQAAASTGVQARTLLEALVAGPSESERAAGLRSALPQGTHLADAITSGDQVTVELVLPEPFLYGSFDPLVSDEIVEQIVKTLYATPSLHKFHVLALDPRDATGVFKPISYFLFEPSPARKNETQAAMSRLQPAAVSGSSLSGKSVYLSAGHGWYWNATLSDWRTQRPAYNQIIEDMNNAEVVNQYLIPYLRNAGASVWPVREEDMNPQEIIVTNRQPSYSQTGKWGISASLGYGNQAYPYTNTVSSSATATATWTFTPTATSRYAVYVWYNTQDQALRAPDAQYFVVHDGGTTEIHLDQQVHGTEWRYIGTFPFVAGVTGKVVLTNLSAAPGTVVIADSVRVGGGMGTLQGGEPPASPGPSGKPRWEEASRYWSKYQGAPPSVYSPAPSYCTTDDCRDVTARPLYAEWTHPSSEDAVFISWHTNGGAARGTESYIYDGSEGGSFTPGSDRLQSWVQTSLVNDIRAGWESGWPDRGLKQADFGEVRALETMPGTLVEIGFHDQVDDANALKDPRFAQLTARAMYKGILRFFAQKDGSTPTVLPEPPRNLIVRNSGPGQVTISWRPSPTDTIGLLGDAATGYRVYTSTDGLGWSDGVTTTATSTSLNGLAANQLAFVRVTALNAGGESFPTPIAAVRVAPAGAAPVLIVYGYERIDRWMDIERCDTPTNANCPNVRIWPQQMNNQSYMVQHAQAISLPLDSVMRGAIDDYDLTLDSYGIVDWIAGQEQTPASIPNGTSQVALTSAERTALAAYLNSGRALFMSGAEVAFDLNQLGQQSFLNNILRAQFVNDNANTFTVMPSASGIFSGLTVFNFDDGTHNIYRVGYPDVLSPVNGSATALAYTGGTGGTAAIHYANGCQRLIYLGFPLETIYPDSTRQAVMSRAVNFSGACLNLPPQVTIVSPVNNSFYNTRPPINGIATGWTLVDHVDVALVDVANSKFLSGTSWVGPQTWLSATGKLSWAYTPSVTLADGAYAVWARAWTTSGLSSTHTAMVTFTMDTVAPTIPVIITPTGGITLPGSGVTLIYTPAYDTNGVAGYTIQIDGNLYTTTAPSYVPGSLKAGPHTWRVRAFDAAGNASAWATAAFSTSAYVTYLPIVLRDYSPPPPPVLQCKELIANGGFETHDAWYSLSSLQPSYVSTPSHSGLASLQMGLTTTPPIALFTSIQQTVTIPLTATTTRLTFWRYPVSHDTTGDYHYVGLSPNPTTGFSSIIYRSNEQAWTQTTMDLSGYTGTLYIRFGVYNDGLNGVTAMYLDDVSVQACRQ